MVRRLHLSLFLADHLEAVLSHRRPHGLAASRGRRLRPLLSREAPGRAVLRLLRRSRQPQAGAHLDAEPDGGGHGAHHLHAELPVDRRGGDGHHAARAIDPGLLLRRRIQRGHRLPGRACAGSPARLLFELQHLGDRAHIGPGRQRRAPDQQQPDPGADRRLGLAPAFRARPAHHAGQPLLASKHPGSRRTTRRAGTRGRSPRCWPATSCCAFCASAVSR